ncbi:MAG: cupin domain-containing protein [Nitrosomonadaceae bacterium]
MKNTLLGGRTPTNFLREYWQKKPLLVRSAVPGFKGLLSRKDLMSLSYRDDSQSRLVMGQGDDWQVEHGPFIARDFSHLSHKSWTLLVQDVNHFLPSARDLLRRFDFIPHARLDDLMVSYAPRGGGVGPHFDSYDVFLLQGMGRRLWQISSQHDHSLIEDAPLRILSDFRPEQEWILEPGDLLYLPPGYAHHGVAEDDCMTYSIGFRAPSYQELTTQFLVYLQDSIEIDGIYHDPDISLQRHPSQISSPLLQQVGLALAKIKWSQSDIERFIGIYLTDPKNHIFFTQPSPLLTQKNFVKQVKRNGLHLDLKSRMLCRGGSVFLNGEAYPVGIVARRLLERLADQYEIEAGEGMDEEAITLLFQWYLYGYIVVNN